MSANPKKASPFDVIRPVRAMAESQDPDFAALEIDKHVSIPAPKRGISREGAQLQSLFLRMNPTDSVRLPGLKPKFVRGRLARLARKLDAKIAVRGGVDEKGPFTRLWRLPNDE